MKEKKVPIWSKVPSWAWALISLALAVALWLAASGTWPAVFASPEKVLAAFLERAESGLLWEHVWASVSRVLTGFGIAFVVSIPVAFLMAWYDPFRHVVEPWIQFIRNIPPLAYVPLIVIAAGVGRKPQIIVITIACFLIMCVTIYQGVINVDETLIKAARVLGATDKDIFIRVIAPATLPFILTAIRLGASVALTTLIAAESTGAMAGLGMCIRSLNNSFEAAPMLLYIIIIGILGITIEKLIKTAERRLTSWQEKREI